MASPNLGQFMPTEMILYIHAHTARYRTHHPMKSTWALLTVHMASTESMFLASFADARLFANCPGSAISVQSRGGPRVSLDRLSQLSNAIGLQSIVNTQCCTFLTVIGEATLLDVLCLSYHEELLPGSAPCRGNTAIAHVFRRQE